MKGGVEMSDLWKKIVKIVCKMIIALLELILGFDIDGSDDNK